LINMETQKDKTSILKARAQKLAEKTIVEENKKGIIEVLEFKLGQERYAVESHYVREVYPLKEVTSLPSVPSFILGVINVRRKIITIIDLRKLFELPSGENPSNEKTIIIEHDGYEFGLLAEEIIGLKHIALDELEHNFPTLTGVRQEFLEGITPNGLTILKGDKLLKESSLFVREIVQI